MFCPDHDPWHVPWFHPRQDEYEEDDPRYEPPSLRPKNLPADAVHVKYLPDHGYRERRFDGWVYCRPKNAKAE